MVLVARWNTLIMEQWRQKTKTNNIKKQYGVDTGAPWDIDGFIFQKRLWKLHSSWRKTCSAVFPSCCGRALKFTDFWVAQLPQVLHRMSDIDYNCVIISLPWAISPPRTEVGSLERTGGLWWDPQAISKKPNKSLLFSSAWLVYTRLGVSQSLSSVFLSAPTRKDLQLTFSLCPVRL